MSIKYSWSNISACDITWKGRHGRIDNTIGKKEETLAKEMKRSPDERHTQTHKDLAEMF